MRPRRTSDRQAERAFTSAMVQSLRRTCGVAEGDGVLVACSGGADSVALLLALHELSAKRRWRLRVEVAHVQHHLRDGAEADAAFVAELAARLELTHHRRDLDPATQQRGEAGRAANVEDWARRGRYAALRDVAELRGLRHVATAHHADDQLETVLMRLLRGSAIHGMAGIAPRRPLGERVSLIRPVLSVTRASLRSYLTMREQPWRDDPTNTDATRTRATLRREVLPGLMLMRPGLPKRLHDWTRHAQELSTMLRDAARGVTFPLERVKATAMNPTVLDEALRQALLERGTAPDRLSAARLTAIRRAIVDGRGDTRMFEVGGASVRVERDAVTIAGSTAAANG